MGKGEIIKTGKTEAFEWRTGTILVSWRCECQYCSVQMFQIEALSVGRKVNLKAAE